MLLFMGDCEGPGAWRPFRIGRGCSFDGGAGGGPGSERIGDSSPRGPRGPRESSTASSRVAWAPTRRGVLEPLAEGDLGVRGSESPDNCGVFGLVSESI